MVSVDRRLVAAHGLGEDGADPVIRSEFARYALNARPDRRSRGRRGCCPVSRFPAERLPHGQALEVDGGIDRPNLNLGIPDL